MDLQWCRHKDFVPSLNGALWPHLRSFVSSPYKNVCQSEEVSLLAAGSILLKSAQNCGISGDVSRDAIRQSPLLTEYCTYLQGVIRGSISSGYRMSSTASGFPAALLGVILETDVLYLLSNL